MSEISPDYLFLGWPTKLFSDRSTCAFQTLGGCHVVRHPFYFLTGIHLELQMYIWQIEASPLLCCSGYTTSWKPWPWHWALRVLNRHTKQCIKGALGLTFTLITKIDLTLVYVSSIKTDLLLLLWLLYTVITATLTTGNCYSTTPTQSAPFLKCIPTNFSPGKLSLM